MGSCLNICLYFKEKKEEKKFKANPYRIYEYETNIEYNLFESYKNNETIQSGYI